MKLSKRQLRKMILQEIRLLNEGAQTVTLYPRTYGWKGSYKVPFEFTTKRESGAGYKYIMKGNKPFSVDGREASQKPSGYSLRLEHDEEVHKVTGSGTVGVKSVE